MADTAVAAKKNIEGVLKDYLADAKRELDVDEITNETALCDAGGCNLDSLDFVELIMHCEEQFDIMIPEEDGDKLDTFGKLVEYIKGKVK